MKPELKPETRKSKPKPENWILDETRTRSKPEKAEPEIPETRKIATRLSPNVYQSGLTEISYFESFDFSI